VGVMFWENRKRKAEKHFLRTIERKRRVLRAKRKKPRTRGKSQEERIFCRVFDSS